MSLARIDKAELLSLLLERLEEDLRNVTAAQKLTQEGATHEENRSESDKDMRATEVSYLARGQAARVVSLREELGILRSLSPRPFGEETPLAATALIRLEQEGQLSTYFLMPGGGGLRLQVELPSEGEEPARTVEISVLTLRSPLGQNLIGLRQGDVVGLDESEDSREYEIVEVA